MYVKERYARELLWDEMGLNTNILLLVSVCMFLQKIVLLIIVFTLRQLGHDY